ncbi:MAG: ACT domain-containing protein [Acetanaerobacterium sp.]
MNGVSRLTVTDDVALITINRAPASAALLAQLLGQFSDAGINIDMISHAAPQGEFTSLSFSILGEDLVKALSITAKISETLPTIKPLVSNGNCQIQLFGTEMETLPGVAARAMKALAKANVDITIITTSAVDISVLVTDAHKENALAALRAEFAV